MADRGSQAGNAALMSELTGLTHDIFVGRVVNNVRRESKVSMLFQDAEPGEYRLEGQNMVFAVDLRYKTGSMATDGNIPDHPYHRRAIDEPVPPRTPFDTIPQVTELNLS